MDGCELRIAPNYEEPMPLPDSSGWDLLRKWLQDKGGEQNDGWSRDEVGALRREAGQALWTAVTTGDMRGENALDWLHKCSEWERGEAPTPPVNTLLIADMLDVLYSMLGPLDRVELEWPRNDNASIPPR